MEATPTEPSNRIGAQVAYFWADNHRDLAMVNRHENENKTIRAGKSPSPAADDPTGRFLLHLNRRSRWLFIYAGTTFVSGALGLELVGGAYADWYGFESIRYIVVMTAEEMLEMLGVILFIYALLDYVHRRLGPLEIKIRMTKIRRNPLIQN